MTTKLTQSIHDSELDTSKKQVLVIMSMLSGLEVKSVPIETLMHLSTNQMSVKILEMCEAKLLKIGRDGLVSIAESKVKKEMKDA